MRCVLFTDIKSSSLLWKKHVDLMPSALKQHERQISTLCDKHQGLIIKSLGDAFMISIVNILDCIEFCIDLAKIQVTHPIKLGSDFLRFRIGFSYGEPIKKNVVIQNNKLIDFVGPAVNIASRMESKVSDVGGFAFTMIEQNTVSDDIIKYLQSRKIRFKILKYGKSAKLKIRRSVRLLSGVPINYENEKNLNGVGSLLVYKCKI